MTYHATTAVRRSPTVVATHSLQAQTGRNEVTEGDGAYLEALAGSRSLLGDALPGDG